MRRIVLAAAAALLCFPLGTVDAKPIVGSLGPGGFMSGNVDYVGTIPLDAPGVGGRVVPVGAQRRLYVTGGGGLTIYDVTNPALPLPLGHLALPHFQNEDVDVSKDGSRVILSGDSFGTFVMYVIDASIVQAPRVAAVSFAAQHTMTCANDACTYLYTSGGDTYDLRTPGTVTRLGTGWLRKLELQGIDFDQGAHDLNRAADGRMISDTVPRVMMNVTDPVNPTVITYGYPPSTARLAYQHNNLRPRAESWVPRANGDTDPLLRAGELMLSNGETNFTGVCGGGSGPFATWSAKNFDKGEPLTHIATFRPMNGTYQNGNPAVNAMGCSGHWFTERDDIVAMGFYDHGVRFLHVNPQTGAISEVGFFQPGVTEASGAYWIDDEYVYTVDYARGIDILRFDRGAQAASAAEIAESWMARANATSFVTPQGAHERMVCDLAMGRRG